MSAEPEPDQASTIAGPSSSACARRASTPSRMQFDGVVPTADVHARPRRPRRAARRPTPPTASRGAWRPAAGTAAPPSSTWSTAAASSRSTRSATCSARISSSSSRALDLGDLIGIDGTAFKSRRGELTLRATGWPLLAKSLRAPPEKFHGLEDVETRYRHRELDLIANEESARALHPALARWSRAIRRWLDERGFLEVETPVLQPLYGGALARPFVDPPQRARPRPLPANRRRALPQAPDRRRARAGLRDRQGLPQRGRVPQAQPRVHDARVVRGVRGLRGHRRSASRS